MADDPSSICPHNCAPGLERYLGTVHTTVLPFCRENAPTIDNRMDALSIPQNLHESVKSAFIVSLTATTDVYSYSMSSFTDAAIPTIRNDHVKALAASRPVDLAHVSNFANDIARVVPIAPGVRFVL